LELYEIGGLRADVDILRAEVDILRAEIDILRAEADILRAEIDIKLALLGQPNITRLSRAVLLPRPEASDARGVLHVRG